VKGVDGRVGVTSSGTRVRGIRGVTRGDSIIAITKPTIAHVKGVDAA
jgi:hypothetical protein